MSQDKDEMWCVQRFEAILKNQDSVHSVDFFQRNATKLMLSDVPRLTEGKTILPRY